MSHPATLAHLAERFAHIWSKQLAMFCTFLSTVCDYKKVYFVLSTKTEYCIKALNFFFHLRFMGKNACNCMSSLFPCWSYPLMVQGDISGCLWECSIIKKTSNRKTNFYYLFFIITSGKIIKVKFFFLDNLRMSVHPLERFYRGTEIPQLSYDHFFGLKKYLTLYELLNCRHC